MPESLLTILKLCALALLYLFFLRVVRAVWSEVNSTEMTAPAGPAPGPAPVVRGSGGWGSGRRQLVVVEPSERRGHRFEVGEELTLGRAASCHVSLEDSYVSQLHARVFLRDGTLYVEDMGSTNGTYLNTTKVDGTTPLKRGDRLKVGATVMEVDA